MIGSTKVSRRNIIDSTLKQGQYIWAGAGIEQSFYLWGCKKGYLCFCEEIKDGQYFFTLELVDSIISVKQFFEQHDRFGFSDKILLEGFGHEFFERVF